MISVDFKLNGKKVNPNNIGDLISKSIFEVISKDIKQKLSSVRCPEHNQYPKITVEGKSIDKLSFNIGGCCDNLIELTKNKIK